MIRAFLAAVLLLAPAAPQVRFHLVEKDTVLQRLASAPLKNEDREHALVHLFAAVGCKAELQPVKHSKLANVICTLPGSSPDTIIVAGHFDKVDRGKGIVDDWSGASMLPTLYESLKTLPRRHTFIFVAFADEEKGLVGSRYYVQLMSPDARSHAKEMINLECLGMNPTEAWASHSDPKLLSALTLVAKGMNIPVSAVNVEKVGTADSESFAAAKIPRTTIHSVDQKTLRVLHSESDNMKAIHPDLYYESYRLIAGYLAAVDDGFDRAKDNKKVASHADASTSSTGTN
ncbi:MAG: M28 family metallopeptidase [Terriglobales bacterium]